MKPFPNLKQTGDRWLVALVLLGLLLRLAFLFKGATTFYGVGKEHLNGDSFSFIRSFLNLWKIGHYTLEPLIPDASFGRMPGYPFFYGLHYLLFGQQGALPALAVSQVLLDTAVIVLLHNLMLRWSQQLWPARLVALLYATYPFAIIWVTIAGTETLTTFLTVAWLGLITRPAGSRRYYLLVGFLVALVLCVRVYMGILLPISLLFVWVWPSKGGVPRWQRAALVLVGFGALYGWWPVRNYVNHSRVMLLKPASAGYPNQREDMQAYLDWLGCWTNDNTTWLERLLSNKPFRYPAEVFGSPAEARRAYALTALAARCGSSFHLRRLDTHDYSRSQPPHFFNCNARIAAGFDSLRRSYARRWPVSYYTAVPLANFRKAFFKSATVHPATTKTMQWIQWLLFGCRTVLLLLGVAGLLVGRRCPLVWPVAAVFLAIYLYIGFGFRSLEMRYLLQADVLLLLPAAWALYALKKAGTAAVNVSRGE